MEPLPEPIQSKLDHIDEMDLEQLRIEAKMQIETLSIDALFRLGKLRSENQEREMKALSKMMNEMSYNTREQITKIS